MREVPILGMGHSLGVRLQAVSCSDPRISRRCLSMGKRGRLIRSGRDGMVYLGFANWGARSLIPGVESLDGAARKMREAGRRRRRRWERRKDRVGDGGVGRRDDVWDDGTGRRGRRRRDGRDEDDDYDDDCAGSGYGRYDDGRDASEDLDLADVIGDVDAGDGARRVGEALEPDVEDLEFSNPPDELWDDLSSLAGWYCRSCGNNLVVQFEDDPIDQGSRLARALLAARDAAGGGPKNATVGAIAAPEDDDDDRRRDGAPAAHGVKFAMLSRGHLTPVTLRGDIARMITRGAISLLSSSYDFVLGQVDGGRQQGRTREPSHQKRLRDVEDVADTVASYIRSLNAR